MKSKLAVFSLLVCFIAAIFLAQIALADGDCGKGQDSGRYLEERISHKAWFMLENKTELALSEDQIKKIEEIKLSVKKEMIKRGADIEIVGIDIEEALHTDQIDVTAVNSLLDQKYDLKKEKAKYLVVALAALKGVLTEEQMSKLKELWQTCDKEIAMQKE